MPPLFVTSYKSPQLSLIPAYAARPRALFTAGANGCRLHSLRAAGNNASQVQLDLYLGEALTLQANMSTGTHVDGGGSNDTITRGGGSFLTDGWRVGEQFAVMGSTTLANDYMETLTGVVALTLTFATGTVNTGEVLPAGSQIVRLARLATILIPPRMGCGGAPALQLLDPRYLPWLQVDQSQQVLILGPSKILMVRASATLGSGEQLDITGEYGDY